MDNRKLNNIESALDFNFTGHYFQSNGTEKKRSISSFRLFLFPFNQEHSKHAATDALCFKQDNK